MKKVVCMVLAAVMLMACLAGCGSTTAPTPEDSASAAFKIGGTAPLTGGAAIYGNAVKNAAQIAVDEINAKGGIQFELRYEDDQNDPEKAVNAYNTLKDWGMQISRLRHLQALRSYRRRHLCRPHLCSDAVRLLCRHDRGQG